MEAHAQGASEQGICRVCVVTNEIAGASKNGGIGTAYTSLVHVLAEAGHEVTVLLIPEVPLTSGEENALVSRYAVRRIELVCLSTESAATENGSAIEHSLGAYRWLQGEPDFHVIHFPECRGYGFYSVQAKRAGLAFLKTTICLGTHSSTEWIFHANEAPLEAYETLSEAAMERASVANADLVLSPSAYLVDWMKETGWQLPKTILVQPYVQRDLPPPAATSESLSELVFFGRLETRKGLDLFCEAVTALLADGKITSLQKISFLGREGRVGEFAALEYLEKTTADWGIATEIHTALNQEEALRYLTAKNRLAVIASPVDNSPNTVYECLALNVPFIAAKTGGIPELIHPDDIDRATFEPSDPVALSDALRRAIMDPSPPIRPAITVDDNRDAVCRWHARLAGEIHPAATGKRDTAPYILFLKQGATLTESAEQTLREAAAYSGADIITGLTEGKTTAPLFANPILSLIGDHPPCCEAALIRQSLAPATLTEDTVLNFLLQGHRHLPIPKTVVANPADPVERSTYEDLHSRAERIRPHLPQSSQQLPMLAAALHRQAAWLRSEVAGLRQHLDQREDAWKTERSELKGELKAQKKEVKQLKKQAPEKTEPAPQKGFFGRLKKGRGGGDA